MFRPSDIQLFSEYVEAVDGHAVTGATVAERANLGWTVRYTLRFDDDVEVRSMCVCVHEGRGAEAVGGGGC